MGEFTAQTHRTTLVFSYADAASAALIERAVRVEAGAIEGDRTRATVARDGAELTVTVAAADLTALRAGTNTWTTLVGVAEAAADAGRRRSGRSVDDSRC